METKTDMQAAKGLAKVLRGAGAHWVGDGFPVRSLFNYTEHAELLSPFLLLDYGGPAAFPPTEKRLGVGAHPHRGFETVTVVFDGEVEHRDSSGAGGRIGPGDVQWMTAGRGVVHEEFHGREFAKRGGAFEMAQLWVNLPKRDKLTAPRYQELRDAQFPVVEAGAARVRVIAGEFRGQRGPALTFSPLEVLDVRVDKGGELEFPSADGHTAALVVLGGEVRIGSERIGPAEVAVFQRSPGAVVRASAAAGSHVLFLGGAPIPEPVVGRGPFVMNTEQEIWQAIADFQAGRMGALE
jgi:redox-sensitive bicupin YhaK (pirin superfamily)